MLCIAVPHYICDSIPLDNSKTKLHITKLPYLTQWASHGAIKVMEIYDELIAIKIVAPVEPHVRVYITVGGVYPTKP